MKQVLRRLWRAPLFTVVAIVTLALGIGANTAIFSVLEGVLLKPLPYPHPEELIGLKHTAPGVNIKDPNVSPSIYFTYRDENRTFASMGIYTGDRVSVTDVGEPERVDALLVTFGVLPTLGVQPMLGRLFSEWDDSPGSPETLLLSYGYWQRRFGGDKAILGKNVRVDGKPKQVIGILPRGFRFLDRDPAIVQPFRFDRSKTMLGNFSQDGVARLKPGVTLAQANADAARMLPTMNRTFQPPPGFSVKLFEQARIAPNFHPFKQDLTGDIGATLWVLMATIGGVLLIACANVANLLLVRVESRHMELAIRAALGASARRVAYDLLLESMTVALLGGACGLLLAFGALRLLVAVAPAGIPRIDQIGIDSQVLLFAITVSLLTGLLFGSAPILKFAGSHLNAGLREGGRAMTQSRERHRARNVLVVVQVALALVLLISSGLMIRTFRALTQVQPGFREPEQVQTLSVAIPETQVPESVKVLRMEEDIAGQLQRLPGVMAVAMTTCVPMGGNSSSDLLFAKDRAYREGQLPPVDRIIFASPGFHEALGTALVAGRDFNWNETHNRAHVVVVSAGFARDYWGSAAAALHKQIRESTNDPWREVVGVVADVYNDGVDKPAPASAYFPLLTENFQGDKEGVARNVSFVVRSPRTGSEAFLNEVRRAIWSVNPNLPLAQVRTLESLYKKSMARTSFTLVLLLISAGMALLLGAIGIYGVIAYSVAQRGREISIRMALGAERNSIIGMFVRHGVLLAAVGAGFGLVSAFVSMRLLSSLLFAVSPSDPFTYGAMLLLIIGIAALASYLPSRRAAAIDPASALRA